MDTRQLPSLVVLVLLVVLMGCEPRYFQEEEQNEYDPKETWDLALGQPVTASSFIEGFPPESIIDGSENPLCWRIDGLGLQWLELTLDGPGEIERLEMEFNEMYKGKVIEVYGRTSEGQMTELMKFDDIDQFQDNLLTFEPKVPWGKIEMVRLEFPNPPKFCLERFSLFGRIPGRTPTPYEICRDVPDVIYHNGTVITMDPGQPTAEAVAIRGDKIFAVGSNKEILAMRNAACATRTINLEGLVVMPGFNDAHSHWFSWREHSCYESGDTINTYPPLEEILDKVSSNGWTSTSALGFGLPVDIPEHFRAADSLDRIGALPFRLYGYWNRIHDVETMDQLGTFIPGRATSGRVKIMGVKFHADDPFGTTDIISQEQLNALAQRAHNDGWQIAVHAVNTSAVELTINAIENVLGAESNEYYRHRIEHAVKVSDAQLARMRDKGIIASFQLLGPSDWPVQGSFQTYITNDNTSWIMRWHDFMDRGVPSVGSTDAPFNNAPCDYSPFKVIYQAVTRNGFTTRPREAWELNQRLTIEQAIKLLTVNGAYATFEEDIKGSITPGKYADLVVVTDNPLEVGAPERLLDIDVLLTLVGAQQEFVESGYEYLGP